MKILLTGADGQLGRAICRAAPAAESVIACGREQVDITSTDSVAAVLFDVRPDAVINCAAYTDVEKAEDNAASAFAVNADGVAGLSRVVASLGTRLIHISTDYVFSGAACRPYRTDAEVAPLSVYGESKLAGERTVLEQLPDTGLVIRTSWLYSAGGENFMTKILRRLSREGEAAVVDDQVGTPTSADSLAAFVWQVLHQSRAAGILHWTDGGVASWYDFAVAVGDEAHSAGLLTQRPVIRPIATEDYPTRAKRPAYSVLDKTKAIKLLGEIPRHWRHSLAMEIRNSLRA